jgi:UDP-N-acetylglucosamine 2-epimerase (non-hydrolysing)
VKKVLSIVGARPQIIKAFPVSKALKGTFKEILVHTGQHYDREMSQVFFEELGLYEPHYNLEVGSGSHAWQVGNMLIKLEKVLREEKPDLVLVYGDTNSTLAGALAAVKLHIPVAHVEAGLRSFDLKMPEEVNRVLTDRISRFLFCPTKKAVENLKKESLGKNAFLVGDVMYDASLFFGEVAEKKSKILEKLDLSPREYLLCTIHRASNTDNQGNLSRIVKALCESGENIIFPAHPRTIKYLKKWNLLSSLRKSKNVRVLQALGYFDFLLLEKNAKKILTDSGGVQKEAYFYRVPCITLRENTEWVETVESGWNVLVGTDPAKIVEAISHFTPNSSGRKNFYGEGNAALKIVKVFEDHFSNSSW